MSKNQKPAKEVKAWTLKQYLSRRIKPKKPLIDGLLYSRELVTFGGRRRHGKTTLLMNLAAALTLPRPEFLGYEILDKEGARVLAILLEDDPEDIQKKLTKIYGNGNPSDRLRVMDKSDFSKAGVAIDTYAKAFWNAINCKAKEHEPNVILLDNYAKIIKGGYNDGPRVARFVENITKLSDNLRAAVIVAAHPKKQQGNTGNRVYLKDDSELFYEQVMGSSELINATGSLWAVERYRKEGYTIFHGGRQRAEGDDGFVMIELDDSDRLIVVCTDLTQALSLALSTPDRKDAWKLLPRVFSFTEGHKILKAAGKLKSSKSYDVFLKELVRNGLIKHDAESKTYRKMV